MRATTTREAICTVATPATARTAIGMTTNLMILFMTPWCCIGYE
jgi:hypothetical protein